MPLVRKPSTIAAETPAPPSALRTGATNERWSAARGLTAPADVPALTAALRAEPDARVREAILTSLARIGTPESAEAVIPYIRSEDAGLRTAALDSLRTMPGHALAAGMPGLLADADPDVRLLACELLRTSPGARATQLLSDLIDRDPEANVCAAAIDVLAEVGGADALSSLERCAARFATEPFLVFATKVAIDRIRTQPADRLD